MKREKYQMANDIRTNTQEFEKEKLNEEQIKRFYNSFLSAAGTKEEDGRMKKNRRGNKKTGKYRRKWALPAACAAGLALMLGLVSFGDEVQAAITHIGYSISSALGLESDLSAYKEAVNSVASDKGYSIVLQEVVASQEELVVSYTIQREDGKPLDQMMSPFGQLYFNGKEVLGGSGGGAQFLDEAHTVLGYDMTYDMKGLDLTGVNEYELKFTGLGYENTVKGKWVFRFTADGSELIADTGRTPLDSVYTLPNGVTIRFTEFSSNDLAQRIDYTASDRSALDYDMKLTAVDGDGNTAEFYVSRFSGDDCTGFFKNAEILENGRINPDAGPVSIKLYAVKMPEGNGKIGDDYVQLGEEEYWELSGTKEKN